jgi:hypothetical protein
MKYFVSSVAAFLVRICELDKLIKPSRNGMAWAVFGWLAHAIFCQSTEVFAQNNEFFGRAKVSLCNFPFLPKFRHPTLIGLKHALDWGGWKIGDGCFKFFKIANEFQSPADPVFATTKKQGDAGRHDGTSKNADDDCEHYSFWDWIAICLAGFLSGLSAVTITNLIYDQNKRKGPNLYL